MLSCHEKRNHDVSDFMVLEEFARPVSLLHKCSNHVVFVLIPVS